MSWRDNLIQATFRDIPFKVETSSRTVGRRIQINESNNSENVTFNDLGIAPNEFIIEGYIIQNISNEFDYFGGRDALIEALNTKGSGVLNHPFYGTINVVLSEPASFEETFEEGGIARFSMSFILVDDAQQLRKIPIKTKDVAGSVDGAVAGADADASDNFFSRVKAARAHVDTAVSTVKSGINKVNSAVNKIKGGISSAISTATGALTSVLATVDNLIDSPCAVFNLIKGAGEQFSNICGLAGEVISGGILGACSGTQRGTVTKLTGDTVPRDMGKSCIEEGLIVVNTFDEDEQGFIPASQENNIAAIIDSFKYSILAELMRIAIRTEFLSVQEALTFTESIQDAIDDLLLRLGSQVDNSNYDYISGDDIDNTMLFNAVEDMRDIFVDGMYTKTAGLTKEVDYKVPVGVLTDLELAYNLYDDIERADEIYTNNEYTITHPGFLPSGDIIKVLNE